MPTFDAEVTKVDQFVQIFAWFHGDSITRVSIVLLDIEHHIQPNNIHLLARPLGRLQNIFEDSIDLLRRTNPFGKYEQSFTFDCSPYSMIAVSRITNTSPNSLTYYTGSRWSLALRGTAKTRAPRIASIDVGSAMGQFPRGP
jgi:hypothetical protein